MERSKIKLWRFVGACLLLAAILFAVDFLLPIRLTLKGEMTVLQLVAVISMILSLTALFNLASYSYFSMKNRPACEASMVGRLYWIAGILCAFVIILHGFGILSKAGTLFTLFGGMLLGWSLQAPVSGFAAWVLMSLKRPFRPGDRVQFPKLELTGDIKDIGAMYMQLNQVGGSIASEEAVGRNIFIPNAMLFDQVVINYTSVRGASYMLDEVVVRITYNSNWETAEKILLDAAYEVTKDTVKITGVQPYIRSELYDYGVYLQLRYQVLAKDRAEIAYKITKLIFEEIQRIPSVDIAIPYIYSYRTAQRDKPQQVFAKGQFTQNIKEVEISGIRDDNQADSYDVEQLALSIDSEGLLRPIVLEENPDGGLYEILAGRLRFQACKKLGWKTIPAMIVKVPDEGKYEVSD
ncbi:MAG: mechanosensitive ion channel [Sedimentisphaerales bacterium]|nr:mechanosensitive ion channel [Sedimentisphaerales bacterium]